MQLNEEQLAEKWRGPFTGQLNIFGDEYKEPSTEPIETSRGESNDYRDRI